MMGESCITGERGRRRGRARPVAGMQQLQSQGLCLGKWNGNTDYSGGGHVETCKYKIAQFKTQTKDVVGGAGHVGSGATCKEQAAECPCVEMVSCAPFTFHISSFQFS